MHPRSLAQRHVLRRLRKGIRRSPGVTYKRVLFNWSSSFPKDGSMDQVACKAANAGVELKKFLVSDGAGVDKAEKDWVIGAAGFTDTVDFQFFATGDCGWRHLQSVTPVVYENDPYKYIWEKSCFLHCQLPVKLPFYYPMNNTTDASKMYSSSIEAAAAKFKGAEFSFILEFFQKKRAEVLEPRFFVGLIFSLWIRQLSDILIRLIENLTRSQYCVLTFVQKVC